jgi:hypothetical protein
MSTVAFRASHSLTGITVKAVSHRIAPLNILMFSNTSHASNAKWVTRSSVGYDNAFPLVEVMRADLQRLTGKRQ